MDAERQLYTHWKCLLDTKVVDALSVVAFNLWTT